MYALVAGGFVLLFAGGEFLVRGAVVIARRLGVSSLLIGLTVVAFGTSAPELLVSLKAALAGNPEISIGNVVGSNTANILLILGFSALIKPVKVDRADIRPDAWVMMASSVALVVLGLTGVIERWQGALLFGALITYVVVSYRRELKHGTTETDWHAEEAREFDDLPKTTGPGVAFALVVAGVIALIVGADWLVAGAMAIGEALGVPTAVLGLTVVAIGTSLPELATSVVAAIRGHSDVAVGNVVGSNIFNILSILGLTAMVTPVAIGGTFPLVDIPVMTAIVFAAGALLIWRGAFGRIVGVGMLAAYVAYVLYLYLLV
jgi:cation:H+ antiporter